MAIAKAKEQPLAEHGRPTKEKQNKVDNVNFKTDYNVTDFPKGNSREYLAARLSRDFPKILDEIGKGKKYKSVRSAINSNASLQN